MADLILPDHAALESWLGPHSRIRSSRHGSESRRARCPSALRHARDARCASSSLAQGLGGPIAAALPYKTFDEMLRAAFMPLRKHPGGSVTADNDDDFWDNLQDAGGWWTAAASAKVARPAPSSPASAHPPVKLAAPQFDGESAGFAFYFLPYASQSFRDGSLAHLPWLQEMPDALTTAMWSSWVEINPKTAQRMEHWARRFDSSRVAAREAECCGYALSRHRSRCARDAHRARSHELQPLRDGPRRKPAIDPRASCRFRDGRASLGRNAREIDEAGRARTGEVDYFLGRGEPLPASGRGAVERQRGKHGSQMGNCR